MNQTQIPQFIPYETYGKTLIAMQQRVDSLLEGADWRAIMLLSPTTNATWFAAEYATSGAVYPARVKLTALPQDKVNDVMNALFQATPDTAAPLRAAFDTLCYDVASSDPDIAASATSTYISPSRIILQ
jgi:hypothetical protein